MSLGTYYIPPLLPYDNQLPLDYARKQVAAPVPEPEPEPTPTPPVISPDETVPVPTGGTQMGGPWYGDTPPSSPAYGWLWVNPANNGLYVFTDPAPGVWTQVGTNW